jgi:hypothetical protein
VKLQTKIAELATSGAGSDEAVSQWLRSIKPALSDALAGIKDKRALQVCGCQTCPYPAIAMMGLDRCLPFFSVIRTHSVCTEKTIVWSIPADSLPGKCRRMQTILNVDELMQLREQLDLQRASLDSQLEEERKNSQILLEKERAAMHVQMEVWYFCGVLQSCQDL